MLNLMIRAINCRPPSVISEGHKGGQGGERRGRGPNGKQLTNICHPQSAETAISGSEDLVRQE